MNNQRGSLKNTLNKKVPLEKREKNVDVMEKQIHQIHFESGKDIVRTTIHLPNDIHRKIKMHCVSRGLSFKDYVTHALVESIEKQNSQ